MNGNSPRSGTDGPTFPDPRDQGDEDTRVCILPSSPLTAPLHSRKELVGQRGSPFVPSAGGNERRTTLVSREKGGWTDRTFPGDVCSKEKNERERGGALCDSP